jgi:hypothetical protein
VKPLAIELFAGCMTWSAGWLALGGRAVGFDIEHLPHHGDVPEGAELVLQDVLTLNGAQFKDAAVILASPPCTQYSYLAMPWSRSTDPNNSKAAKALRKEWETTGPDNRLFDACFRIQREAIEATRKPCDVCGDGPNHPFNYENCRYCKGLGYHERYIPMVVENVRGAQPWVGRAKANYGSFYLWGDVAQVGNRIQAGADIGRFGAGLRCSGGQKNTGGSWFAIDGSYAKGEANDPRRASVGGDGDRNRHTKVPGFRFDGSGGSFQSASVEATGVKVATEGPGGWFAGNTAHPLRTGSSKSSARKAASAQIARIPYPLSLYVAQAFWPAAVEKVA